VSALWWERPNNPAEQLRHLLERARAEGLEFFAAWAQALPRLEYSFGRERDEWQHVLRSPVVVDAWLTAYTGVERHDGADAVSALDGMHTIVAAPEPTRAELLYASPPDAGDY
jgi:hypothetical protein